MKIPKSASRNCCVIVDIRDEGEEKEAARYLVRGMKTETLSSVISLLPSRLVAFIVIFESHSLWYAYLDCVCLYRLKSID